MWTRDYDKAGARVGVIREVKQFCHRSEMRFVRKSRGWGAVRLDHTDVAMMSPGARLGDSPRFNLIDLCAR
jgi:hypothetical protein